MDFYDFIYLFIYFLLLFFIILFFISVKNFVIVKSCMQNFVK